MNKSSSAYYFPWFSEKQGCQRFVINWQVCELVEVLRNVFAIEQANLQIAPYRRESFLLFNQQ